MFVLLRRYALRHIPRVAIMLDMAYQHRMSPPYVIFSRYARARHTSLLIDIARHTIIDAATAPLLILLILLSDVAAYAMPYAMLLCLMLFAAFIFAATRAATGVAAFRHYAIVYNIRQLRSDAEIRHVDAMYVIT